MTFKMEETSARNSFASFNESIKETLARLRAIHQIM
jgi:hypothetical protein